MVDKIKTRSSVKDIKILDKGAVAREKVRASALKSKDIADPHEADGSSTPEGYAREKIQSVGTEAAASTQNNVRRVVNKNLKSRIKTKENVDRINAAGQSFKTSQDKASAVIRSRGKTTTSAKPDATIKSRKTSAQVGIKSKDIVTKSRNQAIARKSAKSIKTYQAQMAKRAVKQQKQAAHKIKTAQKAAQNAKRAAKAAARAVRALISAMKSLVAAMIAGGWVTVIILIVVVLIAAIAASPLGVFFSNDNGTGMTMREAVEQLNGELSAEVQKIEDSNAHDELEINSDGEYIDWKEVISIYACKTSEDKDNPLDVVDIDETRLDLLRTVMYDMNKISYETKSVTKERTVTTTDADGNEVQETESVTITVLVITITHKTADQMATDYGFTKSQKASLAELVDAKNDTLWASLLGGYTSGGGSGEPTKDRVPTDIFSWPLEVPGTITSWFGYRKDPFTGAVKYHNGTDISVPEGTPILAAADGTVTIANGTDSYGGGYGYYVKIKHNGTYDTLYAHCSKIAVRKGDTVTKGQIIAYVGTTGRSTGPHLHFEVYKNGQRTDALSYFK